MTTLIFYQTILLSNTRPVIHLISTQHVTPFELGRKRATAIKARLIKQFSISAQQIEAKRVGEYSSIANNLDDAGQKQNRHVE
ncbi:hypothetical protein ACWXWU_17805 [Shewanella sp. A14]